ncbi:hypothetical protein, variant 2 [Verruconis gallopava]|uniref:Uncharacterized protein n=1 Tax=Verruconis gallopava TaxID=253628 RepID=A0A0D2A375_9PEZI|nr:hypothetical protein, variant 2 [Verruconis gallopava]KIW01258.1 hypothetical protein, variant 2 [Verruconis gallopava]
MIAPADGRQWVKRQVQEPVQDHEQWATRRAEIEAAVIAKRQLGFEITLGNAVFSIGLNSNGLPAFTVTEAVSPTTKATTTAANTPVDTSAAAPVQTTAANTPQQTATTPVETNTPVNTATANTGAATVNTASGNTVLPTSPLVTFGTSTGTLSSNLLSVSSKTGTITGQYTTTEIIFAGGTPVTSVMTMGATATQQASKHLSPPAIAGAVVGAVGGTAALLLLLVLCVRWRRHVRDNKRLSRGGESVRALHTGPAPMMAHNSARFTNIFPQGRAVAVDDDASSSRMAFLPAGAAGFLNRASGSPLRSDSPSQQVQNSDAARPMSLQNAAEHSAPKLPVPPLPTANTSKTSGEVQFLAADASTWLNRNSNAPVQAGDTSASPMGPVLAVSHSASTRSLPSQTGAAPNNGEVAFLPAQASVFLNRSSVAPDRSTQPGSDPAATASNSSAHSLALPTEPVPGNGQVSFLPADASGFLNRHSSVPTQPSGPGSQMGSLPSATVGASSTPSVSSQAVGNADNSQVTYLPADASGFLNRNSTMPPNVESPNEQTSASGNEPTFQKISGYKVPSQFDSMGAMGPSSVSFSGAAASLAIPTPAHMIERDSAGTSSNHSINNNSEWFGSDAHDSRIMPAAAVAAAAAMSRPPVSPEYPSFDGSKNDKNNSEVDNYLASVSSQQAPAHPYSQDGPQEHYSPPQFGASSAHAPPDPTSARTVSHQDFGSQTAYPSGPAHVSDVGAAPQPSSAPGHEYNAGWGEPATRQQWPDADIDGRSWYQPNSPDMMTSGSGGQVMSWPKPPDVDWDRPRVRPKDAF